MIDMIVMDTTARIIGKAISHYSLPVLRINIDASTTGDYMWVHGN